MYGAWLKQITVSDLEHVESWSAWESGSTRSRCVKCKKYIRRIIITPGGQYAWVACGKTSNKPEELGQVCLG